MGTKIFVGGLAWATTDDSLRDAFASCGTISESKVITDRDTGRSRGFGFVTFTDEDGCRKAIESMDGQDIDGRAVRVNEAENKPRRDGGGGGRGGGGGGGGRW